MTSLIVLATAVRLIQSRDGFICLQVQEDCTYQDAMIAAFAEQNYDVMYECNEQLLQFCQVSNLIFIHHS